MNDVLKVIARRRSVRRFRKEQISKDELAAIIEAGLQAPSAHNDQSCYFSVVQNQELIRELSDGSKAEMRKAPVDWIANAGGNESYNIYYDAPTVVIVAARKDAVSPLADVCAAVENILLAAESLDIGSCWIGFAKFYFINPGRNEKIGIPEGYAVQYAVALGYKPKGLPLQRPQRKFKNYFHIIK